MDAAQSQQATDEHNAWRLATPGIEGWTRTARADDPNKYFMVSTDGHVQEPADLWRTRIDAKFRDRLPGVAVDAQGRRYQKTEGFRPVRIRNIVFEGEDRLRNGAGETPEERLADLAMDGVDAEVLFPNKGLVIWATPDAEFSQAMCRVWNDWAWEVFGDHNDRLSPMGCIAAADLDGAVREIERVASLGFRGLALPCKPIWGCAGPRTSELQPARVRPAVVMHQRGRPADHLPRLHGARPAHIAGQRRCRGELRGALAGADHGAHRESVRIRRAGALSRPALRQRRSGQSAGCPGPSGRSTRRTGNTTCSCGRNWRVCQATTFAGAVSQRSRKTSRASTSRANTTSSTIFSGPTTTPHHEGTWPHSAAAIERTMGQLTDAERAKVLGLNAARIFRFPIPERYHDQEDVKAFLAA